MFHRNGKNVYRRILACITGVLMILLFLPYSFFASSNAAMGANGSLSYIPEKKLISDLTNAGFEVLVDSNGNIIYDENGNITLNSNVPTDLGSVFEALFSNQRHTALKNSGVLSYEVYQQDICSVAMHLVIVLDFSAYGVGTFSADSLQGMRAALAGGLFSKYTETAPLYSAATGEQVGTANLSLGGFGGFGSSSMTQTVNGVTSESISLSGFTLRIVPPAGSGKITFKAESITFNEGLLNPPTIVEFDLTRFTLADSLVVEDSVTGSNGTKHLHILASNERAFTQYSVAGENWTIEKFMRSGNSYQMV